MKKANRFNVTVSVFLSLCLVNTASAGVLHWLSQIESDAGPIINNATYLPKISTNGRYVSFGSAATNFITNDNNGKSDVMLKDLNTGQIQLITLLASGQQFTGYFGQFSAPTSDGRYVAFASSSDELPNAGGFADDFIYLKDLVTGALTNLSEYDSGSYFDLTSSFSLSDDAQYITFSTYDQIDPLHIDFDQQVYRKHIASGNIELLSVSADGTAMANDAAILVAVSDNNRFVLFRSKATNLTTDVMNNSDYNLFRRDTSNNSTTLINITPGGASSAFANTGTAGDVSNTGSVIFNSTQSDLVINDSNGVGDVFTYNNGIITRLTLDPNGNQITSGFATEVIISGDGTRMAFKHSSAELIANDNNNHTDIFAYQVSTGTLSLVTKNAQNQSANNYSLSPSISLDGNRLVYGSLATDLTNTPSSPIHQEVFAHQFSTQNTLKVTIPAFNPHTILSRIQAAYGSSDQLSVVYSTPSNNLTNDVLDLIESHVYLFDRTTNSHQLITNKGYVSDISPSGQFVVFISEFAQPEGLVGLGAFHLFLFNRDDDSYTQIDEGTIAKVNDEGKVIFSSSKAISNNDLNTSNDIYYFNPNTQTISLISTGLDGFAESGSNADIGGNGSNTWVVFSSSSDQLVSADLNGNTDVFMKKLPNGSIFRISQTTAGLEGNGYSTAPNIANNGNFVSFLSTATNLTSDDYSAAGNDQILLYDLANTSLSLASKNDAGLPLYAENASLYFSSVSDSGRYLTYPYEDDTLDGNDFLGDDDGLEDVVLFDTVSQTGRIISKTAGGQNSLAIVGYFAQVMEDLSVSPSLVGVLFTASAPADLTGVTNHPGHEEAFLYQQGGPNLDLNIQVIGSGEVNGTSSTSCQSLCNFSFALGTELTIVATPDSGMLFQGWQVDFGSCNDDSNPCDLIMDRSKTLTAVFFDPSELIFADGFE